MIKPELKTINWLHPVHFLSLGFGSGLSPVAPGTFGTVAAIPVFLLLANLSLLPFIVVTLLLMLLGFYLCGETAKALNTHDHPAIVWDEVVGYLITMIAVPLSWQTVLVGFILFRFFDIIKPWPIKWVDKHVHGGIGIMMDDVLAGVMSCLCLHLLVNYFGDWLV